MNRGITPGVFGLSVLPLSLIFLIDSNFPILGLQPLLRIVYVALLQEAPFAHATRSPFELAVHVVACQSTPLIHSLLLIRTLC